MEVGIILGVLSIIATIYYAREKEVKTWLIDRYHLIQEKRGKVMSSIDYDSSIDQMYILCKWGEDSNRTLDSEKLQIKVVRKRPEIEWIPKSEWEKEVGRLKRPDGTVCYLVDYEIDHHEGERGRAFEIKVTPCKYYERLATENILNKYPESRKRIAEAIKKESLKYYVERSLPSAIFVMVSVVSSRNRLLVVQRSQNTDTRKGQWTLGPCETMMLSFQKSKREDFFELTERCLAEEYGLNREDYGKVNISCLAYYLESLALTIYAQVKLKIPENKAYEKALNAPSNYENERLDWVAIDKDDFLNYISRKESSFDDRHWHENTRLGLIETVRTLKYI